MSQNTPHERHITLGQSLVSLADVLTDESGDALDLTGQTVTLRLVTAPEDEAAEREVILDNKPATIDDADTGQVSYVWDNDDIQAIRDSIEATGSNAFWYWWIREEGGRGDRHPGDGDKAKIIFARDW